MMLSPHHIYLQAARRNRNPVNQSNGFTPPVVDHCHQPCMTPQSTINLCRFPNHNQHIMPSVTSVPHYVRSKQAAPALCRGRLRVRPAIQGRNSITRFPTGARHGTILTGNCCGRSFYIRGNILCSNQNPNMVLTH